MFELTLCLSFERQKFISEFYKSISQTIKSGAGIIIKHNGEGKSYLSFAVLEENKEFLKSKVLDFVVNVVENDFKYNFFKENISISEKSKLTEAFFRSISTFDEEVDKDFIRLNIEFSGEIVIESLFYFKLQPLVEKWKKTAEIINKNLIMHSDSSMSEVLKYFCAFSDNNSVLVDLRIGEKQIEMKNFETRKKFKMDIDGISKMFEELIKLNPLKINVKDSDGFGESYQITTTLLKVFHEKIYFI